MQPSRQDFNKLQIMARFTKLVADVLGCDSLVLTTCMTAAEVPGWDSLTHIEIIVAVEEHFKLRLLASELVALSRVEDWVSLLTRRTSGPIAVASAQMTHTPHYESGVTLQFEPQVSLKNVLETG